MRDVVANVVADVRKVDSVSIKLLNQSSSTILVCCPVIITDVVVVAASTGLIVIKSIANIVDSILIGLIIGR